ncbi:unnamed protein product [Acanthoscelides obtectus]|uniref:Uncharacterized protein n=1 Tax=Acanthoscelides obtectus TaxID=200917 RepID=A0A9P0KVN4_ACAOB|nr:unnamed protein product [Acanthoscelides obtectus]CAK1657322.1 hypothetical protein AOBTE_LOCUS20287 [Acanthoscelides obtectus]
MMFTYDVKEKPLYLYNENHVYADVVLAGQSTLSTIKFNFTRIGDAASSTTVAPTTTEDPLYPIPSGDVSDYSIVVNVSGKTLAKFRQEGNRQMFKRTLSKMAQAFCIKNDIRPSKPITTSSIDILWTSECPATWTNCAPCVSCGFAIPLFFNKSATTRDYQLTADNLDSMWREYADNYLDGGLRVCQPPDTVGLVKWQLIAFSAITVIFVIGLLVIRHFTIRINDRIRSKILKSDDQWSDKKSILKDLGPHPLQEMPQIFEDTISDHNQYALISNPVEPVLRKTFEGK